MSSPRNTIQLSPDEISLLRQLHAESGIPDGQFALRPEFLQQLVETFNTLTDRSETPSEVHRFIMTRRKRPKNRPGRWEPFGAGHEKKPTAPPLGMTADDWDIVGQLYVGLGDGADNFLVDIEMRTEFVRQFTSRTGKVVPPLAFAAAVIDRRKAGLLPRTGDLGRTRGFNDIGDVDDPQ